ATRVLLDPSLHLHEVASPSLSESQEHARDGIRTPHPSKRVEGDRPVALCQHPLLRDTTGQPANPLRVEEGGAERDIVPICDDPLNRLLRLPLEPVHHDRPQSERLEDIQTLLLAPPTVHVDWFVHLLRSSELGNEPAHLGAVLADNGILRVETYLSDSIAPLQELPESAPRVGDDVFRRIGWVDS